MTISGPAALITGASRGIGEAIAARLADAGWSLTLSARGREALDAVAGDLRAKYGIPVRSVAADMAVENDVYRLFEEHQGAYGRLDVLVLNAGMGSIGPLADFPLRRLDKLLTVNVRSAYQLIQVCLPALRQAGATARGGKVIALASTTGIVGEPLNSAYGASKAALIALCETLNTEESASGVTATAVCPGYVATDMTASLEHLVDPADMLPAGDVAEVVAGLTRLSRRSVVPSVVLTRPGQHLWRA